MHLSTFPGGQLIHLWEMIRAAEDSGFEVLDVENLRSHYVLTCRRWEQRLAANRDAALLLVDEPTFRAWRIWLAASALSFADGFSSLYQVLMSKRGAPRRRLTRDNMYSDPVLYRDLTWPGRHIAEIMPSPHLGSSA